MRAQVGALSLAAVTLITLLRYYVWPRGDEPFADGPIVVLGGGGGERLTRALQLRGDPAGASHRAQSRELVLSAEAIDDHRRRGGDDDVSHLVPVPPNTLGEALAIARLVDERGWSHVTVVTSDFHVTRTRLIIDRCVAVPVAVVPARTHPPMRELLWRIGRELIATGVALLESHRR